MFYANKNSTCDPAVLQNVTDQFGICRPMSNYSYQLDNKGLPLIENCTTKNFVEYYYSAESTHSFEDLYQNKDGL